MQYYDPWWWPVSMSETYRVLYQNKVQKQCNLLAFVVRVLEYFSLYIILFMILQLGALGTLIDGVLSAVKIDSVNADDKTGKFEFWYQWRNNDITVKSLQQPEGFWVRRGTSILLPNLNTRLKKRSDSSQAVILPEQITTILWEGFCLGPIAGQNGLEKENSLLMLPIETQFLVISARSLIIFHLRYPDTSDDTERAN
jgi:hypothetical protein